ncbi:hypothetical protein ACTXT7_007351 [Hymenolepis weldensis]
MALLNKFKKHTIFTNNFNIDFLGCLYLIIIDAFIYHFAFLTNFGPQILPTGKNRLSDQYQNL